MQEPFVAQVVTDLERWKARYGKVYKIEFFDEDEKPVVGYFRKPDRKVLSYISTLHNQPFKMQEQIVLQCWLGGDELIKQDETYMLGAAQQLQELIAIKQGELKEV